MKAKPYKCHRGHTWYPFIVDFHSPDGKFSYEIWGLSFEHALLQLDALKETSEIVGQLTDTFPVEKS